jgi:hypothetical protein
MVNPRLCRGDSQSLTIPGIFLGSWADWIWGCSAKPVTSFCLWDDEAQIREGS